MLVWINLYKYMPHIDVPQKLWKTRVDWYLDWILDIYKDDKAWSKVKFGP